MKNGKFLFYALLFIVTACTTTHQSTTLTIEVYQPAQFELPQNCYKAGLIYRKPNYQYKCHNPIKWENPTEFEFLNVDSLAARQYFESFTETLRNSGMFDTIYQVPDDIAEFDTLGISPYSLRKIQDFNIKYPDLDILFSFDYFQFDDETILEKWKRTYSHQVFLSGYWFVYLLNDSSKIMYFNRTDTTLWEGLAFTQKDIEKDLYVPLNDGVVKIAAQVCGNEDANMLVPHWHEVDRMMYTSSNYEMTAAQKYAMNGKWAEAIPLWKINTKNKNKNIAAKSMYNLALASETAGFMDAAIEWVIASYFVFGETNPGHSENCKQYIRVLSQRKIDIEKLNRQFIN